MSYQKSELYFLFTILAVMGVVTFLIFQPFIYALILALIFSTVFSPVHKKILSVTGQKRGLAALLATVFVLIVIFVPVAFLSTQIFHEATDLYSSLMNNGGMVGISRALEEMARGVGLTSLPSSFFDFGQHVKSGLTLFISHFDEVFSNVARIVVGLFVVLVALYYLFKDGYQLKKSILGLSPLHDMYDEIIFSKLDLAINSVVKGSISVGIIQGILTAIGLAFFGVPSPVLWGSVAAIAALVPGFGTSLVLVPSILFLFFSGATVAALGLLMWWLLAIALVDNILGPRIVSRGVTLHPFLIILSILGGISFFGPLGFLFGPLALSLLFAILEIYSIIRGERNK